MSLDKNDVAREGGGELRDNEGCMLYAYLCRSKARTVPSSEALTTTLSEGVKTSWVTAAEWSEKVTKQKPVLVFQSLTC